MKQLLFRNYHPLFNWMFSVTWTCGALAAAFLLFWVKGTLTSDPMGAVIVLLFVVLGFWMDLKFLQIPVVSIWQQDSDNWLIVRRWIWKDERENVVPQNLPMPTIEEGRDGEGGRDYRCHLRIPSGIIEFGKHHRRDGAERTCDRMRNLLRDIKGNQDLDRRARLTNRPRTQRL